MTLKAREFGRDVTNAAASSNNNSQLAGKLGTNSNSVIIESSS